MLYTIETLDGLLLGVAETHDDAMKLVRTYDENDKAEGTYKPGSYIIGHGDDEEVIQ